ncbi:MAG: MBL fold metallo-hydrolase [Candidatus Heimdallarchaeota archaeon]
MRIEIVTDNIVVMYAPKELELAINTAPTTAPVTCIALPERLIIVDTGIFVDVLANFRKEMEKKYNRKISHLLLTHLDWDHMFAMEVFEDVKTVASEHCIENMKYNLTEGYLAKENLVEFANNRYPKHKEMRDLVINAKLFLPTISVKDELRIGPEENSLLFKVVGGHTKGSSIIYSSSEKTICVGDNLLECYPPLQHEFNNPISIYKQLEELDIEDVIPGHGKVVSKDYIIKTRKYYEDLEVFLKKSFSEDLSINQIQEHPQLPKYFAQGSPGWKFSCRPTDNWLQYLIEDFYETLK